MVRFDEHKAVCVYVLTTLLRVPESVREGERVVRRSSLARTPHALVLVREVANFLANFYS